MREGVLLREAPVRGLLDVRGPVGAGLQDAAASELGLDLPLTPCRYARAGERAIYWLGPDEWLLAVRAGTEADVEDRLRKAITGQHSVVDVSGGHLFYNLSGPAAGCVLMKASPYDFDDRDFGPGRCVQTVFAKTTALIAGNDDHSFDVVIRRSYVDYLMRWLEDAAAEYGFSSR